MILHGYFRSSSAYRLRIALNLKGVTADCSYVHLTRDGGAQKTLAYRRLNPQGLVPALEFDDGHVLTQSLAILEWLEEQEPDPPLLPKDLIVRAKVRAFALAIACEIHPLQNLRVLNYLRSEFGQDQNGIERWCQRWIGEGLSACEALANAAGDFSFCFGDSPSMADVCLVPQMFSADRFNVDLTEMPRLRRIRAACEALPEFAIAHPSRQPDAEY